MRGPYCDWPNCMTPEAVKHLLVALDYEERTGEPYPNPDLTDYRALCGCEEPPRDAGDGPPPF